MSGTARAFFGGLPVGPDVERLMVRFGVPQPGVIAYADISATIGAPYPSSRFRTVLTAWRKRLAREHNVATDCETATGLRVLSEAERRPKASRIFRQGARRVRTAALEGRAIRVEQLDPAERQRVDHFNAVALRSYEAMTQAVREIAPPKPLPQLPRRA